MQYLSEKTKQAFLNKDVENYPKYLWIVKIESEDEFLLKRIRHQSKYLYSEPTSYIEFEHDIDNSIMENYGDWENYFDSLSEAKKFLITKLREKNER